MDDTTPTRPFDSLTSPWRNLAWSFRKSRDSWKEKCARLRRELKRLQNQLRDVRNSRERWRQRAEQPLTTAAPLLADPDTPPTVATTVGEKKG
jgi:hypothetical protein